MKTRILTLALALLFVVQLAYATGPSVTIADLYTVEVTKLDGSAVPAGLVIKVVPETETALAVLAKVTAAMKGNAPVVSKFFKDQRKAIQTVLPAGTNANALQLKELASLLVSGYTEDLGDLVAKLTFPTKFEAGKPLAVLVGLVVGEQITWEVLAGVADQDGSVIVTLPKDLLLKVQAGNAVISILQYTVAATKLDGSPAPDGLVIAVVPETETALAVLAKVTAAIAGNKPVVSSFFADQQEAIRNILPAGTNANALQFKELATLFVSGYTEDMGDLRAKLTFPTKFEAGKPLAVLVGLIEGEQITWEVLAGVADQDGNVIVTLPAELLLKVQAGNAVIAILQ